MKFCLRSITKSGRLGLISDVERIPGASFETPLMLFATRVNLIKTGFFFMISNTFISIILPILEGPHYIVILSAA